MASMSDCPAQRGGPEPLPASRLAREYHVSRWNSEDGLPQNFIRSILQTRDGYIWLGTQFGLSRFDGIRFTLFTRYSHSEMVDDTIYCMDEDSSGALWIGTGKGLLRYNHGQFTHWKTPAVGRTTIVRSLQVMPGGTVWATMDGALVRVQDGKLSLVAPLDPGPGSRLFLVKSQRAGEVALAGSAGLFRLNQKSSGLEAIESGTWPAAPSAWTISELSGRVYMGSVAGLHCFENGAWSNLLADVRLPGGDVPVIFEDRRGGIWVGSKNCPITRFHDQRVLQLEWGDPIERYEVFTFFEDREENIWVGTDSGLLRLKPKILRTYTTRERLDANKVYSVSEARDGGVWATTERGLIRIKDDTVQAYVPDASLGTGNPTWAVLEDDSGLVWLGRARTRREARSAILHYRDGRFREFKPDLQPTNGCRALYKDPMKRIWSATSDGVVCWSNGAVAAHYRAADDPFYEDVRFIQVMRDGSLWMASYKEGVRQIRDGVTNTYCTRNQMASNSAWSLYEDPDGVVWVATDNGLHRCERGQVFVFTRSHGLHEEVVNHIIEDDFGNLWLSGLRGIYRVQRRELNEVAAGRAEPCRVVAFGESEGMENAETNGETQPAGCKTRDGRIWFPTVMGLVVIDPSTIRENRLEPSIVIEQVVADEETILREGRVSGQATLLPTDSDGDSSTEPRLRLPPGRARVLEVYYTANTFNSPERVKFKYRLEGYDTGWHEPVGRRLAIYTSLSPGKYRFQVIACNSHGHWNNVGAAFSFILEPHFYETWPFYALCGFVAAAAIALVIGVRLRVQRRLLQLQQQAELERVRAHIAEDMHDDVGASVSQIAILSEVARRELNEPRRAEQNVQRISGIARQLVDSLSELVWATNPHNDTLDNMAAYFREYAGNYFEPAGINAQLEFPPDLPAISVPPETRRALFLVLKEALHNIMKHSKASAAKVMLRYVPETGRTAAHRETPRIELTISDDGRGMSDEGGRPFGNGLRNMKRRIHEIGGDIQFHTVLGKGTTVSIRAPLRPPKR
jgi:ligand-binding sensor domain-containing protein/signal transduction histidine kinase